MKKWFLVFGVLLMTASIAMAQEAKAPPKSKMAVIMVKGEVTSVDAAGNTVTVKGKDKEIKLNVTDKTKIMAGKEKKGLADIKVGDKVAARAMEEDGKTVAKAIRIKGESKAEKK